MNLHALRSYRAQIEEALRAELAALQRLLDVTLTAHARMEALVDEDTRQYLDAVEEGMMPDEARQRYEGFAGLAVEIRGAQEAVAHAQEQCDRKRAEILEAVRETHKLDLLLERELKRQRQAQLRKDQRALDDSAARRHMNQKDQSAKHPDENAGAAPGRDHQ